MELTRTTRTVAGLLMCVALTAVAGCQDGGSSPVDEATPLPDPAEVFETRDAACQDLVERMASGQVQPRQGDLTEDERRAISDQLFAYDDVAFTSSFACGGSTVMSVGVRDRRGSVPDEIDGVPLIVFYQSEIEPF
jgi:hypothetical protein